MLKVVFIRIENIVGKEKCWLTAFSSFPPLFSRGFFLWCVRSHHCVVKVFFFFGKGLRNVWCLVLHLFLSLEAFESNTSSDWLNHTVWPIGSCVTFKSTKSWRKRPRMFLRMVGEYENQIIMGL